MSFSNRLCQIGSDCASFGGTLEVGLCMYIIVRYTQLKHVSDHRRYLLTKKYSSIQQPRELQDFDDLGVFARFRSFRSFMEILKIENRTLWPI